MPSGAFNLLSKGNLKDDRGVTLPLCRCENCGLFQLDIEPVTYYREAIRIVGLSETMIRLRKEDYSLLLDSYFLKDRKWIEIGCGTGDFLKILESFPVEIYGTEAGEENVKIASDKLGLDSSRIINFFPDDEALEIPGGPFDCFLLLNFLEHQPDPRAMLGCIRNNLVPGGIGLITVPAFEYTLENGAYYEIIRDHIANYDISSLSDLMGRCGFRVIEKSFIALGDTIRIMVRKGESVGTAGVEKSGENSHIYADDLMKKFQRLKDSYENTRRRISSFCEKIRHDGYKLALWGASHQGMTMAATTSLKDTASYIIDSSEKKQGLYAPVSHLEIVPPERFFKDPVNVIMITAPEFAPEIEKNIRERFVPPLSPLNPFVCNMTDLSVR